MTQNNTELPFSVFSSKYAMLQKVLHSGSSAITATVVNLQSETDSQASVAHCVVKIISRYTHGHIYKNI